MMWPSATSGVVTSAMMNFSVNATSPNCKVAILVVATSNGQPWASTYVELGAGPEAPTLLIAQGQNADVSTAIQDDIT